MKMLKMSFFDGTLNRKILTDFISMTDKPIKYTYGLGYRSPTTNNALIGREKALQIVESEGLLDAAEKEDCLYLNAYSVSDMW